MGETRLIPMNFLIPQFTMVTSYITHQLSFPFPILTFLTRKRIEFNDQLKEGIIYNQQYVNFSSSKGFDQIYLFILSILG